VGPVAASVTVRDRDSLCSPLGRIKRKQSWADAPSAPNVTATMMHEHNMRRYSMRAFCVCPQFVSVEVTRTSFLARGGLRSTPDCRTQRTFLHLSYSYAAPCGPALLVTQDPGRTFLGAAGQGPEPAEMDNTVAQRSGLQIGGFIFTISATLPSEERDRC
jgi:hypothetical protein